MEHIEYLPVMNNTNRSIPIESVTSTDVNRAIQRSLTKACARHGLGLYIYAGEDLPESEMPEDMRPTKSEPTKAEQAADSKKANEINKGFDPEKVDPPKTATPEQVRMIAELCFKTGTQEKIIFQTYKKRSIDALEFDQAEQVIRRLKDNTKQMSRLIDTLVQDCEALELQTRPQAELDAMLSYWEAQAA